MDIPNTRWRWYAGAVPRDYATFEIVEKGTQLGIKCRLCGMASYNATDVAIRFCSFCQCFHDNLGVFRREMQGITALFPFDLDANGCPDCGNKEFVKGPTGGMCKNLECAACHARFNVLWGLFVAHRIEHNGQTFYDPSHPLWAK